MGMILTWCILVICWYVVSSTEGFEDKVPPPLCDVHSNAQRGYHTPPDLLPSPPSDSGWLYPSEDEIKYWYEKAHTKCQRSAQDKKSAAPVNIPPYYIDNSKYSLAGQQICRGRDTLFDMTGQTVWPFGPITSGCQTYSKCWFGLLSCGDFNQKRVIDSTYPQIVKEMKYVNASIPVPEANTMQWSMRSLVVQLRLLGPEIVVPEQRLVSLAGNVDVIIAQYHLTIPNEKYQLEARLFEFYPAALLPWSKIDWDTMAYQNVASVFLGANEDRCKPWTKCTVPSLCCGCDEKSFVSNTPMIVVVKDQKQRCQAELAKTPTLPLCRVEKHGSNPAGRWLQSTHEYFSSRCEVHHAYSIQHMKTHTESDILTKVTTHQPSANHTFTDSSWFEASGNPCIHAGASENEELGTSHWFFAPYQCKYHFYPRHQLHQCLQDTGITHMHFQGDSMSRELFGMVSKYLGVAQIAEGRLKEMTNDMKMKEIKFHSGNVLLSEGYSWDFNLDVLRLSEQPPLPNVIVTNYALAHRIDHFAHSKAIAQRTEYQYWTELRNSSLPKPKFQFFQNARECHGRHTGSFVGNSFRRISDHLKHMYAGLNFTELDEFQLTAGRFDIHNKHSDGWHFGGTGRQMEVVVLMNMICNEWLEKKRSA